MTKYQNVENNHGGIDNGVILGVDGGATSTVCVCLPFLPFSDSNLPDPLPILSRAVAGCSNFNSIGEDAARDTLEHVIDEALSLAYLSRVAVRAICLAVSGVNHPKDQEKVLNWMRKIFSSPVKFSVYNDAAAALASGTMGKLHGCVLISGTGSISYGITEDGKEARAGGGGPVLGDWGSGYGIAARALTAVLRAQDGRGPNTMLCNSILHTLGLSSPDELIGWTYADPSWARIAALAPVVITSAEADDEIANKILVEAVEELATCVKSVVQRLHLCGQDKNGIFPVVLVGGILEANTKWDIARETINCIRQEYPGAYPIRPKVEPAVGAALLALNLLSAKGNASENGPNGCTAKFVNGVENQHDI
ncbi:uncharacterized protein LOC130816135 isoform X1 [Amaranthus tricolor]|uniref:uncharacterized protein LOC130816135 isoform X1 n=1 Tax=Amaranthus tricolor TaxID=29722 RepID=UPI002588D501|nr:uncharacterized protein LOC130816135 isoform X1 [Amaranthus tricolor]